MNVSNIAVLGQKANYHVREEPGDYDTSPDAYAAAADYADHLYKAQRLVGDALNLTGLVRITLEDQGDTQSARIDTALQLIEGKLEKAYRQIDRHEARYTKLFLKAARGNTG